MSSSIDYAALKSSHNISESNGEVSCSVEETNKLRAALGLRPLDTGDANAGPTAEEIAVKNWKEVKEKETSEKRLAEIEEKLARARRKRELRTQIAGEGVGLGEVNAAKGGGGGKKSRADGGDEASLLSASDWVRRSRKTEKLMAEKRALMLDEVGPSDDGVHKDRSPSTHYEMACHIRMASLNH